MLHRAIHILPENETAYTTKYQDDFLHYVEKEYCAKHQQMPVIKPKNVPHGNNFLSAKDSEFGQSSVESYDLSSDVEEYLTPKRVAETTPGWSNCTARWLTAARLHLNWPREAPKNWGRMNPNNDDYHSNPMAICSTFWLPDITDWWPQQEETHSKYADLSNVVRDILSIVPYDVGVNATFSLQWDVIGCRHYKTTGEKLLNWVIVRQFTRANDEIFAGDCASLDETETKNDLELKKDVEERKVHRMAKVYNFLEMWQGSKTLLATQKESRTQNKQMTAVVYISDTKEIIKVSWSNFQHEDAAAFKLSERSPLPPDLSAKYLPGGWTQVLNTHRTKRNHCHLVKSDKESAPEIISVIENWLNLTGY